MSSSKTHSTCHDSHWSLGKFDVLLVGRPPGSVEIIKVKAHVSSSIVLSPLLDRCRHYNNLADSAAKAAVEHADVSRSLKLVCYVLSKMSSEMS